MFVRVSWGEGSALRMGRRGKQRHLHEVSVPYSGTRCVLRAADGGDAAQEAQKRKKDDRVAKRALSKQVRAPAARASAGSSRSLPETQRRKAKYAPDHAKMDKQLAPHGLAVRRVRPDGNCLFRCASRASRARRTRAPPAHPRAHVVSQHHG